MRIAVADLGSNTLKFSVTEVGPEGQQRVVHARANTIRLGHGIAGTGEIEPERIDSAISALRSYEHVARELGAAHFLGVATAAVRLANNSGELLSRITMETSWRIRVISGDDEARLTFLGLQATLPASGSHIVADVGGASTEIIAVDSGSLVASQSIDLGSGMLADQCFTEDPPGITVVHRAHDYALAQLSSHVSHNAGTLFLAGGNGLFLSQVAEWGAVNLPFIVPFFPILVDRLSGIPSEQVARYLDISPERARMLPAGGAIAWALIDAMGPGGLQAVQSGIRGGLIRAWIDESW